MNFSFLSPLNLHSRYPVLLGEDQSESFAYMAKCPVPQGRLPSWLFLEGQEQARSQGIDVALPKDFVGRDVGLEVRPILFL